MGIENLQPKTVGAFDKDLDVGAGAIDEKNFAVADKILNEYDTELELDYKIPTAPETTPAPEPTVTNSSLPENISTRPFDRVGKEALNVRPVRPLAANDEGGFFSKLKKGLFGG